MDNRPKEYEEKVISIDRVSRTVAGGRRMRFRAAVLVGNKKGRIGFGLAKASDTQSSVQKATRQAKKNMVNVKIVNGTISRQIYGTFGPAKVLLKPTKPGNFIIAGSVIRPIAELAGIKSISAKILGSSSKINNIKATLSALEKLQ